MAVAHWSNGRLLIDLFPEVSFPFKRMCRLWDDENFEIRIRKKNKTKDNQKLIKSRRESRAGNHWEQTSTTHFTWNVRREAGPCAVSSRTFPGIFFFLSVGHQSHYHSCAPYGDPKTERDPTVQLNKQKGGIHPSGVWGKKDKKEIVYLVSWPKLMGPEFTSVRPSSTELFTRSTTSRLFCFVWFFSLMLQSSHAPMDSILISRRRKGAISNRLLPHVNHHQQQQSRLTSLPFKNSTSPAGLERKKNKFVRSCGWGGPSLSNPTAPF